MRVCILADDLTGAADTAVPFTIWGLRVCVRRTGIEVAGNPRTGIGYITRPVQGEPVVSPEALPAAFTDCDVEAWNTASRGISELSARQTISRVMLQVVGQVSDPNTVLLYKKIDSGLRGQVGAELAAALDVLKQFGDYMAIVAPAFPEQGRTTRGGVQYVHGVPVSDTPTGKDPVTPVRESYIPRLLEPHFEGQVRTLPLNLVRQGPSALRSAVLRQRAQVWVADAEMPDDLTAIADAFWGERILWVGSGGLGAALARRVPQGRHEPEERFASAKGMQGWITLCGSLHPISRSQIQALAKHTGSDPLELTSETLSALPARCREQIDRTGHAIVVTDMPSATSQGSTASGAAGGQNLSAGSTPHGVGNDTRDRTLAMIRSFATSLCATWDEPFGFILVGGDTAEAFLDGVSAGGLRLDGELLPGIPLGTIQSGLAEGAAILTKSGGFGSESTLIELLQRLGDAA